MRHKFSTSRREFLAAGVLLLPALGSEACAGEASGGACRPTERGAGGPFYRRGAPWRTKLCGADEPGEPLVVEGRVTAADTCQPLVGAVVDVWQANAAGRYDNQLLAAAPDPGQFLLRGQMKTGDDGRYRFETVVPGNYSDGGVRRARHIHYMVTFPGYAPLVTEMYFEGEPRNQTDPIVRRSLIVALSGVTHEKRKFQKGVFDIVLARAS